MEKSLLSRSIIIIMTLFVVAAIVFLRGEEDTWICENGRWVKHGNPGAPMPTVSCEEKKECSSYGHNNCPNGCVVCPPCAECSSLSCQAEEFCKSIGFDRNWYKNIQSGITNFQECVEAGNPVMESYPRQCQAGGRTFTEDLGNIAEKEDLIRLNTPRPNQIVKSPLTVEGKARGYWFFEGDFPVLLTDWDGLIIGEGIATARDEWMTEEFVPFTAVIEFENPKYKNNGTLILRKDNPSGLPENDDALEVPVLFEETGEDFSSLGLNEALAIAGENKECSMAGVLTDKYLYNENSKTWWIDLERMPELENDGCNPACVVSEETKSAEVNWRCTGLLAPKEPAEEIRELFAEKYPKYAETLAVSVEQETESHARGSVIFETGAPGGIFLAAKIDDVWQLVFDGNGQISCDLLSAYEFPNEMIADCVEE